MGKCKLPSTVQQQICKTFPYYFIIKNTGDVLNFMLKLIDDENEEIKFHDKDKQFPIVNFLLEFLT